MAGMVVGAGKTYIVEHLDEELGSWSELEYLAIARETHAAGGKFLLSSVPPACKVPAALTAIPSFTWETRGVEDLYADAKSRVCLLDPAASKDLAPEDGDNFDVFLFGGILGELCLGFAVLCLPKLGMADIEKETTRQEVNTPMPLDGTCRLESDKLADRTSELRKKGFEGRRLGPTQMTTDTAVRVTRTVVEKKGMSYLMVRLSKRSGVCSQAPVPVQDVPYLDFPELHFNEHESTQMPFRYVRGEDEKPIMPEVSCCAPASFCGDAKVCQGMVDLIKKDADKAIDDLF